MQSKKGGGEQTPAQRLTEELCIKISSFKNKELPDKFWILPEWKTFYGKNIQQVYKLLEFYSFESIMNALKDKKSDYIYYFNSKVFHNLVEQHEKLLNRKEKMLEESVNQYVPDPNQKPRPQPPKQNTSIKNKLKDL